jgi:hypothetical protein
LHGARKRARTELEPVIKAAYDTISPEQIAYFELLKEITEELMVYLPRRVRTYCSTPERLGASSSYDSDDSDHASAAAAAAANTSSACRA